MAGKDSPICDQFYNTRNPADLWLNAPLREIFYASKFDVSGQCSLLPPTLVPLVGAVSL